MYRGSLNQNYQRKFIYQPIPTSWMSSYRSSLRQLPTAFLYAEIRKLENSIKHLRRSNEELKRYCTTEEEDTSWILPIIVENEQVIKKQSDQVKYVKQEISERAVENDHTVEDLLTEESVADRTNGGDRLNGADRDQKDIDEFNNGLHL
jgi:hypothetical protein